MFASAHDVPKFAKVGAGMEYELRKVGTSSDMPLQTSARALKSPLCLDDEVRFLRSWIEKPLHMGAVMPSGKLLARTMAQYVEVDSEGPVVELGPGTGAITSALIE